MPRPPSTIRSLQTLQDLTPHAFVIADNRVADRPRLGWRAVAGAARRRPRSPRILERGRTQAMVRRGLPPGVGRPRCPRRIAGHDYSDRGSVRARAPRLRCGDATAPATVARALDGLAPVLMSTDHGRRVQAWVYIQDMPGPVHSPRTRRDVITAPGALAERKAGGTKSRRSVPQQFCEPVHGDEQGSIEIVLPSDEPGR